MAKCTAPVNGHHTASGAAACPVCGNRSRGYGSYSSSSSPYASSGSGRSAASGSGSSVRPRWSPAGSSVVYTPAEVRTLTPFRENVDSSGDTTVPGTVYLIPGPKRRQTKPNFRPKSERAPSALCWFAGSPLARAALS